MVCIPPRSKGKLACSIWKVILKTESSYIKSPQSKISKIKPFLKIYLKILLRGAALV